MTRPEYLNLIYEIREAQREYFSRPDGFVVFFDLNQGQEWALTHRQILYRLPYVSIAFLVK